MSTYHEAQLDALGDATRRAILSRLIDGPLPVGEIARDLPVSRPAISQHLRVLKEARLVTDRADGARRLYALNPEAFDALREYFDRFWTQALAASKPIPQRRSRMTVTDTDRTVDAVRKTITVQTSPERAFHVFTAEYDSWWPRSHHIGKSPMKRAIIEGRAGGRCYTEQEDSTDCDWGSVLVWDPPHRLVIAWQIDGKWQFEPDLAKSSEVEVRFTAEPGGRTRVDLEHRHLDRHGVDAAAIRTAIDSPNGWGGLLQMFVDRVEGR